MAIFTKDYRAPIHDLMAEANLNADQVSDLRRHPELHATGALVQNILLAATEEGLGTCWISGALVALDRSDSQPHPKEPLDFELYVNYVS